MSARVVPIVLLPLLLIVGCATKSERRSRAVGSTHKVRTTAYTHTEPGGRRDAVGRRLACGRINSAAADWSRFPLGTKFKILDTGEICQITDYGSALVGTETIDLYKTSRLSMRSWGVRFVNIKILEWGSPEKSLEVLAPRARNPHVREMINDLRQQS